MTSTTDKADTTQHPDVSEISDLTEGLLSPAGAAAVRQHLEGCRLCADVRTSLEEIRGLLGTLPGPSRMPAEIAGRIDAALAAEALLNATAPHTDADVSRETNSRPDPHPVLAPAQAADRPAGRSPAATGPGRTRKPRRRRRTALGAVLGAAALGMGVFLLQGGLQTLGGDSGNTTSDTFASSTAPSRFDGQELDTRVQALLQQGTFKAPKDSSPESLSVAGGDTPQRELAPALPECIKAGTRRTDTVIAFQQGDYQGTNAYLVVLPHPSDSSHVQAYVLDASCTTDGGKQKADVLLTHAYPRS
ncbi:zf-HC2 domain-containing protein [Streptomyces sp. NPDC048577]|uniref:zf-HC2 domain-containing protein n=1 Tax=Streptomyces sp. NPDC048577 TaxID=3157209 RepID=UPI0034364FA7